jgi:oxygen tolerance protein BatD
VTRRRLQIFPTVGFLFLAVLGLITSGARAANFTASLDRDTIVLGENATLTLTFEGGQPQSLSPLPAITNLLVQDYNNWSQNIRMDMVSGQSSAVFTHALILKPQTTGEFIIPALTAAVNGQRLSTQPLKLTATPANAPSAVAVNSGAEVAFMKLSLPPGKIYAGETIAANVEIYLRDDVQNYGRPEFNMPADGFSTGKGAYENQRREQVGNRVYTIIPVSIALTAPKSGTASIGPFTAAMRIVVPSPNQQEDPVFQQFGIRVMNAGVPKDISLATEKINEDVLPLPPENVPPDFTGAVGDYTMTMTVGPTNVPAGDPVTAHVQISGRGTLENLRLPDMSAWRDFKVFPPTAKIETTDPLGIEGSKTFEEIVTPQDTDVREVPQFSFSFFNPADGNYHTLTNPPVPLFVRAGGATTAPTIAANKNSTPENQMPQDILPVKENLGTLSQNKTPLIAQPKFLAVQSLPLIAFLAAFVWRKRTDNLANNPRLRRQRAVAQLVSIGLNDLKKFAAENKPEEFFAVMVRLLQEQLGERLDCPASAITENVIEEHTALRGTEKTTLDDLRELFQLCNQARYAPVRGTGELNSVVVKFQKTIGELQEVKA